MRSHKVLVKVYEFEGLEGLLLRGLVMFCRSLRGWQCFVCGQTKLPRKGWTKLEYYDTVTIMNGEKSGNVPTSMNLYGAVTSEALNAIDREAKLTVDDVAWLKQFQVDPNVEWLANANSLIVTGSRTINTGQGENVVALLRRSEAGEILGEIETNVVGIVSARREFLASLKGLSTDSLLKLATERPTLIPLNTFVSTQRILHNAGLNGAKIINSRPSSIRIGPIKAKARIENAASLGLDPAKIFNEYAGSFSLAPKTFADRYNHFVALGLNARKIVNDHSVAIGYAQESVTNMYNNLATQGIDPVKALDAFAESLGLSIDTYNDRFNNFITLGLDAKKLLNKHSVAIGYTKESIGEKFDTFNYFGLSPIVIIDKQPSVIGSAPETVMLKILLLERTGHWETIRGLWNAGKSLNLLVLPFESLAISWALNPAEFTPQVKRIRHQMLNIGLANTADRKSFLRTHLGLNSEYMPNDFAQNNEFLKNLGEIAVFWAMREIGNLQRKKLTSRLA